MNCQRCHKNADAAYRAHGKFVDLQVCAAFAAEAWESGLTIEVLDGAALMHADRNFWKGDNHRVSKIRSRPRIAGY